MSVNYVSTFGQDDYNKSYLGLLWSYASKVMKSAWLLNRFFVISWITSPRTQDDLLCVLVLFRDFRSNRFVHLG